MKLYKWIELGDEMVPAECVTYEESGSFYMFRIPGWMGLVTTRIRGEIIRCGGPVITPADIHSREMLAIKANHMSLAGTAVEVGTHRGEFASEFRRRWNGSNVVCVDIWDRFDRTQDDLLLSKPDGDREGDFTAARDAMSAAASPGRGFRLIRGESTSVANTFSDESVCFVYVDGDHRRSKVLRDLISWWPKIRSGGILAGHDWTGEWEHDVRSAVESFCKANQIQECFIVPGDAASWYIIKA